MRSRQETITYPVQNSFKILKYAVPFFNMPFHYHAEYELVYIIQGNGVRYIGSSIHKFRSGDMVFIGPDLAHIWISPEKNQRVAATGQVEAIVLQFSKDLFSSLIETPEFKLVQQLLINAQAGLRISGKTRNQVVKILESMLQSKGLQRFLHLLEVVDKLSRAKDLTVLNPLKPEHSGKHADRRIQAVQHFVMTCYNQQIGSRDAASLANMEQSAFCRFFKTNTGKTFTRFLNETRIDQACRLLLENRQTITQIAYESGFQNMTNFYKQFKRYAGTTPREFRGN